MTSYNSCIFNRLLHKVFCMNYLIFLGSWLLTISMLAQKPVALQTEYGTNPLGLSEKKPRLSWQIVAFQRDVTQSAYQILVADNPKLLEQNNGNVWDSKKVTSNQSRFIAYGGKPLESRKKYYWKVRVWDKLGKPTGYSEVGTWEMGLLEPSDWSAQWIGMNGTEGTPPAAVELEKTFTLSKRPTKIRIYATGLGAYHLQLNGKRVGQDFLSPGWTHYPKTLHYQVYEIPTDECSIGTNFILATVGNGWWSSGLGWQGGQVRYSQGPNRLFFQMELEYYDGSRQTIASNTSWKVRKSPITQNALYQGETYDARLEYAQNWQNADLLPDEPITTQLVGESETYYPHRARLITSPAPPVRFQEIRKPIAIREVKKGKYLFDFGQNLVGIPKLQVSGKTGKVITLKFAELLAEEASGTKISQLLGDKTLLDPRNLRSIRPTDVYICKGYGIEKWEPKFTYHGFQYVEVDGLTEKPTEETLMAQVIHSEAPVAGTFESSNPMFQKLVQNIDWSLRGNMFSVPTDCPQRDERLGWMGDVQIIFPTMAFFRQSNAFFAKWMQDIWDSQHESGYVYDVNPKIVVGGPAKPGWGDAAIIVPWQLYQYYGDKRILEESYPQMVKWVNYLNTHPTTQQNGIYHFETGSGDKIWYGYGDWVPVENSPAKPMGGLYQFYSNILLAKIARVLQKNQEAESFDKMAQSVAKVYQKLYWDTEKQTYLGGTQAAHVLPLQVGITPPNNQQRVVDNLVENIKSKGNHLTTGFLATPALLPWLTKTGNLDLAYTVANQKSYPSWGYMIEKGATTLWELWNSDTEKPEGMNSRNHFAYGAIGEWFYQYLGGILPLEQSPGFQQFKLHPYFPTDLSFVKTTYDSPYGKIRSNWEKKGNEWILEMEVPPNTQALIQLPSGKVVKEGSILIFQKNTVAKTIPKGIKGFKKNNHGFEATLGSGTYTWSIQM